MTTHYHAWRQAVDDLMAEPRTVRKFVNAFPEDGRW
jgi:quinol monooxygenase YgiN